MEIGSLVRYDLVTVGPTHTLAEAAKRMTEHKVGAAIVLTEDAPGIISERDIMRAVARGLDPTEAVVGDHMTWNAVAASPTWDVEDAARTMLDQGFRHLVVTDGAEQIGILSIRDLARALLGQNAQAS